MAAASIDDYLAALDEPKRSTLEALRGTLRELLPDAEECIAYGAPAMRLHGTLVAGFAAYRHHLSYLPHSGGVLASLGREAEGYDCSKGALKFPVDTPLPRPLVQALVRARLDEIERSDAG